MVVLVSTTAIPSGCGKNCRAAIMDDRKKKPFWCFPEAQLSRWHQPDYCRDQG
jgi:hypothetical protein